MLPEAHINNRKTRVLNQADEALLRQELAWGKKLARRLPQNVEPVEF